MSRLKKGDRMNIKRRFFVIATASFLATVTSCSSPQNNASNK
ncbi:MULTISPECIES: hypothetical protein [unclassified Calothrix]|nr:hypothetical protein [Calothrix sp. FACHB-1219]